MTAVPVVVPANAASWKDLQAVFGERGDAAWCSCQWFKIPSRDWVDADVEGRRRRLRDQTHAGDSGATETSGLVAYLEDEPAGWCAVEPRTAYLARLATARIPWAGRSEDKSDPGVWAVTCFVTRRGYRRKGIAQALAVAAVEHARGRGATAVEAYPTEAGPGSSASQLFVGTPSLFAAAGFREVSRPTPKRAVMRVEL